MAVERVGSVLHGAYGDYYEQIVALRGFKKSHPDTCLILFFAHDLKQQELEVFDVSFADEVHAGAALKTVPVDRFLQFQVKAEELRHDLLDHLPPNVLAKFDLDRVLKPWTSIRALWRTDPALCDIPLSAVGKGRLSGVETANKIPKGVFEDRFTVGFLWRYRRPGGFIAPTGQPAMDLILQERSALFRRLIDTFHAHILVCGMNVQTTDENRDRTDNKYDTYALDLPAENVTYLQGLSWGLELETMRRCSLCVVMASGFSEALWLKRRGLPTLAVDIPPDYLRRVIWNRVPFFSLMNPRELRFQLRQPHTAERVYQHLSRKGMLPAQRSG